MPGLGRQQFATVAQAVLVALPALAGWEHLWGLQLAQETCGILRLTWVWSLPQGVSCVFSLLIRQGLPGLKTWFKKLPLFQKSPSWSNLNVFPLK